MSLANFRFGFFDICWVTLVLIIIVMIIIIIFDLWDFYILAFWHFYIFAFWHFGIWAFGIFTWLHLVMALWRVVVLWRVVALWRLWHCGVVALWHCGCTALWHVRHCGIAARSMDEGTSHGHCAMPAPRANERQGKRRGMHSYYDDYDYLYILAFWHFCIVAFCI